MTALSVGHVTSPGLDLNAYMSISKPLIDMQRSLKTLCLVHLPDDIAFRYLIQNKINRFTSQQGTCVIGGLLPVTEIGMGCGINLTSFGIIYCFVNKGCAKVPTCGFNCFQKKKSLHPFVFFTCTCALEPIFTRHSKCFLPFIKMIYLQSTNSP